MDLDKVLDKLKGIITININSPLLKDVSFINFNNSFNKTQKNKGSLIQNISKNGEMFFNNETKTIEINLAKIKEEEKKTIKELINDFTEDSKENILLEKTTESQLNNIYKYEKENDDAQVLNFFEKIISPEDYDALESSLYLRSEFKKGNDITKIKIDIIAKFGDRGKNICNLCSANYFEGFLIPLYNLSPEKFKELYQIVVEKTALTLFVSSNTSPEEITKSIISKLNISTKYGFNFIHIHGIGKHNLETIKKWVDENKDFMNFFEKNIYEKENIIIL
ncbi:MAG: hypothetical protein ABIJ74_04620, partial [archaeon]